MEEIQREKSELSLKLQSKQQEPSKNDEEFKMNIRKQVKELSQEAQELQKKNN